MSREKSPPLARCRSHLSQHPAQLLERALLLQESYKKECQEKNLPHWLDAGPICLGIQPNCLNVHSYSESGLAQAQCRVSSPRAKQRYASPPVWSHFAVVTAPIVSETTSLMVVHWMSGNAWSYWRLVAYGFIRLSEEA